MTTTLDLKHPDRAGTLGAGLLNLDATVKSRVKQVKQRAGGPDQGQADQVMCRVPCVQPYAETLFWFLCRYLDTACIMYHCIRELQHCTLFCFPKL